MRLLAAALLALGIAAQASAQSTFQAAEKLLAEHRWAEALAQLQHDLSFEPENPRIRALAAQAACGVGADAYERGDLDTAIAKAELAIGLDDGAGCAHLIRGRVLADRGEPAEAAKELERAQALLPDLAWIGPLRERVARDAAGEKTSVDHGSSRHFKGEVYGDAPAHTLTDVLTTMESARDQVMRALGATVDATVVVMVYAGDSYAAASQAPEWSAGNYDGKIRVMLGDDDPSSAAFRDRLAHEYAHAVVRTLSRGHAATWLDEGLAMHVQLAGLDGWQRRLAAAKRAGTLRPLASLDGSFGGMGGEQAQLAYDEAYAAVDRMDRDFGRERIVDLLRKLGDGQDPKAAFESACSKGFDRFSADFEGSL